MTDVFDCTRCSGESMLVYARMPVRSRPDATWCQHVSYCKCHVEDPINRPTIEPSFRFHSSWNWAKAKQSINVETPPFPRISQILLEFFIFLYKRMSCFFRRIDFKRQNCKNVICIYAALPTVTFAVR